VAGGSRPLASTGPCRRHRYRPSSLTLHREETKDASSTAKALMIMLTRKFRTAQEAMSQK
jgi:hypothetical protein